MNLSIGFGLGPVRVSQRLGMPRIGSGRKPARTYDRSGLVRWFDKDAVALDQARRELAARPIGKGLLQLEPIDEAVAKIDARTANRIATIRLEAARRNRGEVMSDEL